MEASRLLSVRADQKPGVHFRSALGRLCGHSCPQFPDRRDTHGRKVPGQRERRAHGERSKRGARRCDQALARDLPEADRKALCLGRGNLIAGVISIPSRNTVGFRIPEPGPLPYTNSADPFQEELLPRAAQSHPHPHPSSVTVTPSCSHDLLQAAGALPGDGQGAVSLKAPAFPLPLCPTALGQAHHHPEGLPSSQVVAVPVRRPTITPRSAEGTAWKVGGTVHHTA